MSTGAIRPSSGCWAGRLNAIYYRRPLGAAWAALMVVLLTLMPYGGHFGARSAQASPVHPAAPAPPSGSPPALGSTPSVAPAGTSGDGRITVNKTASPTSLPVGGGSVTYTYTVKNNIAENMWYEGVTDDKCGTVSPVSGMKYDRDTYIPPNGTAVFTCTMTVTSTTVNVVTARFSDLVGTVSTATASATVTIGGSNACDIQIIGTDQQRGYNGYNANILKWDPSSDSYSVVFDIDNYHGKDYGTTAVAVDPGDPNAVYYIPRYQGYSSSNLGLWKLDMATGRSTRRVYPSDATQSNRIAVARDRTVWSWAESGILYSLSPGSSTWVLHELAPLWVGGSPVDELSSGDIVADGSGNLWLIAGSTSSAYLLTIPADQLSNSIDVKATVVGPMGTGTQFNGLSFDSQDRMFATAGHSIYEIDIATGTPTLTSDISGYGIPADMGSCAVPKPELRVTKTSDLSLVAPGSTINYTVTVENLGDLDATNVALTDPVPANTTYISSTMNGVPVGRSGSNYWATPKMVMGSTSTLDGVIRSGDKATITFTVRVNSTLNGATQVCNSGSLDMLGVSGIKTDNPAIAGSADPTCVPTASAGIKVIKTASTTSLVNGGDATYTYAVTNAGNEPLKAVILSDDKCPSPTYRSGDVDNDKELDLRESWVFTCTQNLSTTTTNTATASGRGAISNKAVTATAKATVTVNKPAITLSKTASPNVLNAVGQDVTYTFVIKNAGDTPLTELSLTDRFTKGGGGANVTVTCPANQLAAGASMTCTRSYTATQADLDGGGISNIAAVASKAPDGSNVGATANAAVTVTQRPTLTVSKSPSPSQVTAAGQTVTYTFTVKNTGNVTLSSVTLADQFTKGGAGKASPITCQATTLAPEAATTCTGTYTTVETDMAAGGIDNTVTASAVSPAGTTLTSTATASVAALQNPAVTITKSVSPTSVGAVDQNVTYSFLVTNTGNMQLTTVSLNDTFTAGGTGTRGSVTCPQTTLDPGANMTCTQTYTVTQADLDGGSIKNTATYTAKNINNVEVQGSSSATVTASRAPALTITKTADTTPVTAAGQTVTYGFLVKNTGNVTLNSLKVADTMTAPADPTQMSPISCPATELLPGQVVLCTATYKVAQADMNKGSIVNSATASATPKGSPTPVSSSPSQATVTIAPNAALNVRKSANPSSIAREGQPVTYTFVVTNRGNVTLASLAVVDTFTTGGAGPKGPITCSTTTLTPGQSATCTQTYTSTQADMDGGSLKNTATASATSPSGTRVTSTSSATVKAAVTKSLAVTKIANPANVSASGQTVTYTFAVRNAGNVTVSGLELADTYTKGGTGTASAITCQEKTLTPEATTTCTGTYISTADDIEVGGINNTVTAAATTPDGSSATGTASASVTVTQAPSITISKTANPTTASSVGQVITYSFLITNTGNLRLYYGSFTDTFTQGGTGAIGTFSCPTRDLAPGDTTTCTQTYTVNQADLNGGVIKNTAETVAKTSAATGEQRVNASSSATVNLSQAPSLSLTKSSNVTSVSRAGDTITYTFRVENTGNVTVNDIAVEDVFTEGSGPVPAITCQDTRLNPGDNTLCTSSPYVVTQPDIDRRHIENQASAIGKTPGGTTVTSPASAVRVTADPAATLKLVKTPSLPLVKSVNEVVTYTFVVTNTGGTTLNNLAVSDSFTQGGTGIASPISCPVTELVPEASTICTGTYTVNQADFDAAGIWNTATATATEPGGTEILAKANATVSVEPHESVRITKSASPTAVSRVGDVVTYTFGVANTGNITLNSISVTDRFSAGGTGAPSAVDCKATTLAPGASTTCTSSYTVTQEDLNGGELKNTATVNATSSWGEAVTDTASASVSATQSPALMVTKTPDPVAITAAGQTVTYRFEVTNTGNVRIQSLDLTDKYTKGGKGLASTITCGVATLDPTTKTTCLGTYITTQEDVDGGGVSNTVTAKGTSYGGSTTTATADATVTAPAAPDLSVAKSATPARVDRADAKITYTFVVTNTGNVTMSKLAIADTMIGPASLDNLSPVTCDSVVLAPGAKATCKATYTVGQADMDAGYIRNSAIALASAPGTTTETRSDPSSSSVAVRSKASLTMVKSASPEAVVRAGDLVTYSFVVTNTGNLTLNSLKINDTFTFPAGPAPTVSCPSTTLAPGVSTTCTGTYTASQADIDNDVIANSATAQGIPVGSSEPIVSSASSETVAVNEVSSISVTKNASTTAVAAVGETVTYTFVVTNTGSVSVHGLSLADVFTKGGSGTSLAVKCDATALAPSVSTTCTTSYTVKQSDLNVGGIENTVTATALNPLNGRVTATATETVTATQNPVLTMVKSASPATVSTSGQVVTYTFGVHNAGNVRLQSLTATDTFSTGGTGAASPITCGTRVLEPGQDTTCTGTYTVNQADIDAGSIKNVGGVAAVSEAGKEVKASSPASVDVASSHGLVIEKSATPTAVAKAGDLVSYNFLVRNTGNVTMSELSVSDVLTAPAQTANLSPITCPAVKLAPGLSTTCTATYTVAQADIDAGSIRNSATVTGRTPDDTLFTSRPSTATVTATPTPALTITKTADRTEVNAPGQMVGYTFLVKNTGNVTLADIDVEDHVAPPAGPKPDVTCDTTQLAPGATAKCTASYIVTQDDIDDGEIINTARAQGTAPGATSPTISAPASARVAAIRNSALSLKKSASPSTVEKAGDQVTYTFVVTNTGNTTLSEVSVNDVLEAPAGPIPSILCPSTVLAPGAETTCTATYTVKQADVNRGVVINGAQVEGTSPDRKVITSPLSSATVTIAARPGLELTKSGDPATVTKAGATVTYNFLVSNTGNVTISNLEIADRFAPPAGPNPTITCAKDSVDPGITIACSATYTVTQADMDTGKIVNTATVSGTAPNTTDRIKSEPSTATVIASAAPALTIAKTAAPTTVNLAGQTVNYSFLVTNSGNVTMTGIKVVDTFTSPAGPELTVSCPVTTLVPGGTVTCSAGYVVTQADMDKGSILNSAVAEGTAPGASSATRSAPSASSVTATANSALTMVKSAAPKTATKAGDKVTYSFVVTNTGNVTLSKIAINDTFTAPAGPAPTIACPPSTVEPGAQTTCSGTYTVSQLDADKGLIHNSATAQGLAPGSTVPILSQPSQTTVTVAPNPKLTVVKAADPTTVSKVGDKVTYSFVVTNTGNVTLSNLAIKDTFVSPAGPVPDTSCSATTLAPEASTTCTATYTVTLADLNNGSIKNSATAQGTAPGTTTATVSPPSTATVGVTAAPTLTVEKSVMPTSVSKAGDVVTFSFLVTNTGNVTLSKIDVTDTFEEPAGPEPAIACPTQVLDPGQSITCNATYAVSQADIDKGKIVNNAIARGTPPGGKTPVNSPPSSATVTVKSAPSLSIVKSASPTSVTAAGQVVNYSFEVANKGNVTISNLRIDDLFTSPASKDNLTDITCPSNTLAPAATTTCAASYTTTQSDINAGSVRNSATAVGTAPGTTTETVSQPSRATVVATPSPALTVVKTASPHTVAKAGETITYNFAVTNTGNVVLNKLSVKDTFTAPAGPVPAITCGATSIDPGDTVTCTATYAVKQADIDAGSIKNSATAHGYAPGASSPTSSSLSTTTVGASSVPALSVIKTAAPAKIAKAGEAITYTFAVTNSGNVTISNISIKDTLTAPASAANLSPVTCTRLTLAPGDTGTCTGTYTTTQEDLNAGSVKNSATAQGFGPGATAPTLSQPSTATVPVATGPALTVEKVASPATAARAGDTVTYSFLVTNTGNVTMTAIGIVDTFEAPAGPVPTVNCPVTTLNPGETSTCSGTYTVSQADADKGAIVNSATAHGTPPGATVPITSPADTTTVTIPPTAALVLTKSANPSTVTVAGQKVSYNFAVKNTGNVTMTKLVIDDTLVAPADAALVITCPAGPLAPGATVNCLAPYTVTQADMDAGLIRNSASVTGTTPAGATSTSPPSHTTVEAVRAPNLSVTKSVFPVSIDKPGEVVTYSFVVANTGNVTLTDLTLKDSMFPGGVTCPSTSLAVGKSVTCSISYTATQADIDAGSIKNTATATASQPDGTAVTSPPSQATVSISPAPALTVKKSSTPSTLTKAGEKVTYSFLVTNTGNVTMSNLAVNDSFTAPALSSNMTAITCEAKALGAGGTTTCLGTYTATQDDVNAGKIVNTATVSGTAPGTSTPVVSQPDGNTVTIHATASLTLEKVATPTTLAKAGDVITYRFTVVNTGNVTMSVVKVEDHFASPAGPGSEVNCPTTTLQPGAQAVCQSTYAVTQADVDAGTVRNTAVASGMPPGATTPITSPTDSAEVSLPPTKGLKLTKSANPTTVSMEGQTITYSFLVANTGNVTMSGLSIADTLTSPADPDGLSAISCPSSSVAPGRSVTCTATYSVRQGDLDAGLIKNAATATATAPDSAIETTPPSPATVTAVTAPGLSLTKKANPRSVNKVGDAVTYSFAVTNSGNVTIKALAINDPSLETPPVCQVAVLAPGATTNCTATYKTTQADVDAGRFVNTAKATGTTPTDDVVSSPVASAEVAVPATPGLRVNKLASPSTVTAAGQTVTYSFAVTNTGNVTMSNLSINDTFLAPAGPVPVVSCPVTSLAGGASTTCTASYVASQADLNTGHIVNTATVQGTAPGTTTPTISQPDTVTVKAPSTPGLSLDKTVSGTATKVGDNLLYEFLVRNTGNVTVSLIRVVDSFTTGVGPVPTVTCPYTTLDPSQETTCTATYAVKQGDVDRGTIENSAFAEGKTPDGVVIHSLPDTATSIIKPTPGVTFTKTASPAAVTAAGQTVAYTFVIANTGNTSINNVSVKDHFIAGGTGVMSKITCPSDVVPPGASLTCTASYTTNQADLDGGSIKNEASVSGTNPDGSSLTSSVSSATVRTALAPGLSVTKSASVLTATTIGEPISYSFLVKNTGNVTLSGVSVTDKLQAPASPTPTVTCPDTTLVVGADMTCKATYVATSADFDAGSIKNTATVAGRMPGGEQVVSPESSVSVTTQANPALTVDKTASTSTVSTAGTVVTYRFAVENTGNVTMSNIQINDTFSTGGSGAISAITCEATTLAAGANTTCSATYTTNQADINGGKIVNSATVQGTAPGTTRPTLSQPKTVTIDAPSSPSLKLLKSTTSTPTKVGDSIVYSFLVTNTGNVTLSSGSVVDTFTAPAGPAPFVDCPTLSLDPGKHITCRATYMVKQEDVDAGKVVNTALARGSAPNGAVVDSPESTVTVTIAAKASLTVTKAATPTTVSAEGQDISYRFTVANRGNVTVSKIELQDELAAPAVPSNLSPITCPSSSLTGGASMECTATYSVSQSDVDSGSITNSLTATGRAPDESAVKSNVSSSTVAVAAAPGLSLLKSAEPTSISRAGEEITYTFTVKNTGNTTVTGLSVADTLTGPAREENLTPITCELTALAPDATTTCTATYIATAEDIDAGSIKNTATGSGVNPDKSSVTSPESSTTVKAQSQPALSVVKTADPTSITKEGDKVTYTFVVTNNGNVTMSDVAIEDEFVIGGHGKKSGIICNETVIKAGSSTTCTGIYTATQEDIDEGRVVNSATVRGTAPGSTTPVSSAPSEATVTAEAKPSLSIAKSALRPSVSAADETIGYRFEVTNTGNVTLAGLRIVDVFTEPADGGRITSFVCPTRELKPHDQVTCTAQYKVAQEDIDNGFIKNTATAEARTLKTGTLTKSSESLATVSVTQKPALKLVKKADKTSAGGAGEKLVYSFEVTNTGNVTVKNLVVEDPLLDALTKPGEKRAVTCETTELAPGIRMNCKAPIYTITQEDADRGQVKNEATVSGESRNGNPGDPEVLVSAKGNVVVPVVPDPKIAVDKKASREKVTGSGSVVVFTFEVKNTGNMRLYNPKIKDEFGGSGALPDPNSNCAGVRKDDEGRTYIDPFSHGGQMVTCESVYTVTSDDVSKGVIRNTATVTGTGPGTVGDVVSAPDTVTVTVETPTGGNNGGGGENGNTGNGGSQPYPGGSSGQSSYNSSSPSYPSAAQTTPRYLPKTGAEALRWLLVGLCLVGAGLGLWALARRRHGTETETGSVQDLSDDQEDKGPGGEGDGPDPDGESPDNGED